MNFKLTGAETGDQLIKQLVGLRITARALLDKKQLARTQHAQIERVRDCTPDAEQRASAIRLIAVLDEHLLQLRFAVIEIGKYLVHLCDALDRNAPRALIYEALNIGHADRGTELTRIYGGKTMHLISVLDLENSSTRDDEIVIRPLKWCSTMAFMNALQTSPKLDRILHEGTSEFFGGAFGEFKERPLMDRLAGQSLCP